MLHYFGGRGASLLPQKASRFDAQQTPGEVVAIRTDVLGVGFDPLTMEQAVAQGLRLARGGGPFTVVTPNPEIVMLARRDAVFSKLLRGADLVLPDGVGILYGARILGRPMPARVPGIDFAAGLMAAMAGEGMRLYLLGAKPGVAARAGASLTARFPGLVVCGTADGYFASDEAAAEAVRAARPDVVFVCLGAPKQEIWMNRWGAETGASLLVGLGGSLDVFAGDTPRAPAAFRRLGLEWLYRLLREPRRIGRMAKLPLFLVYAAIARWKGE